MKIFLTIAIASLASTAFGSDSTNLKGREKVIGVYKSGQEILHMTREGFYLERTKRTYQNDVVVPECDSVIAKGNWQLMKHGIGVAKLTNDSGFFRVAFQIRQEKLLSDDTIYIKVILPHDDAFFEGRFAYRLFFWNGAGNYVSEKSIIAIPRERVTSNGKRLNFSLYISDREPNCGEGRKCYHRLSFRVFDDFDADSDANCFTVTLPGFNKCFVDRLDVENDFIYIDGNSIYWRGNKYKRIAGDRGNSH